MCAYRVFRVSCNQQGRDLVVGDVHGCFRTLDRALATLAFDPACDRLFGVGDLVERGPHSEEALIWIESRFVAVALGNHDVAAHAWLDAKLGGSSDPPSGWLRSIDPSAYGRWHDAFGRMPLAVTVETPHGPVGIVHAESPHRVWTEATRLLERGHKLAVALLGLPGSPDTVRRYRSRPVEGVRALVHGHQPVPAVERTGNRWNIDTGAGIVRFNRLSLLEVNAPELRSWTFDIDENAPAANCDLSCPPRESVYVSRAASGGK